MERYLVYSLCLILTFDFIFIYIHTFIVLQCCRIMVVSVISYFPCRCSLTTSGLPCLRTPLRTNPSKALCLSLYPVFFILSNCLNRVQLYKTIKTIVHYLKLNHIINNQTITLKKKKTLLNHALNIQKSRQRPFKTISISTGKKKI